MPQSEQELQQKAWQSTAKENYENMLLSAGQRPDVVIAHMVKY